MIVIQPNTLEEAAAAYAAEQNAGRKPLWYAGGTEILSFLRKGTLKTDCLIDLKTLPEANGIRSTATGWRIGAATPLNALLEAPLPELLRKGIAPIADRTVRNRLTLGGNLCGRLPYREAVLPLLALDARGVLAGPEGITTVPLRQQFRRNLGLKPDQFLLAVEVDTPDPAFRWGSSRKVRLGPVDYPVVHLIASGNDSELELNISGLCPYPVRLEGLRLEQLNTPEALPLPVPPQEDRMASREYRTHLFGIALREALEMKGGLR